jgi:hypothetical protein
LASAKDGFGASEPPFWSSETFLCLLASSFSSVTRIDRQPNAEKSLSKYCYTIEWSRTMSMAKLRIAGKEYSFALTSYTIFACFRT